MDGVCTVAGHVGRELAPHVKKHGGKLIPESMKKDKDGRSTIDGAMVVAASGVQGTSSHLRSGLSPVRNKWLEANRASRIHGNMAQVLILSYLSRICNHVDWTGICSQAHNYQCGSGDGHHSKTQVSLSLHYASSSVLCFF